MENNTTPEQPRFKHDCDACKYLGRYEKYDLYFCGARGVPAVIARWGYARDWHTGNSTTNHLPEIVEAKRRAIAAGLLPAELSEPKPVVAFTPLIMEAHREQMARYAYVAGNTVTIAEVAAKLGLMADIEGNFVGGNPINNAWPYFRLRGRGKPFAGSAMLFGGLLQNGCAEITARQVCELAGVDYDRYEGREPEPQQAESEQVPVPVPDCECTPNPRCPVHNACDEAEDKQLFGVDESEPCARCDGTGKLQSWQERPKPTMGEIMAHRRGLEAGRAEGAAIRAELLADLQFIASGATGQYEVGQEEAFWVMVIRARAAIARAQAAEEAE